MSVREFSIDEYFAGRISEAAIVVAGAAQRPIIRVKKPKKPGARSARARTLG